MRDPAERERCSVPAMAGQSLRYPQDPGSRQTGIVIRLSSDWPALRRPVEEVPRVIAAGAAGSGRQGTHSVRVTLPPVRAGACPAHQVTRRDGNGPLSGPSARRVDGWDEHFAARKHRPCVTCSIGNSEARSAA